MKRLITLALACVLVASLVGGRRPEAHPLLGGRAGVLQTSAVLPSFSQLVPSGGPPGTAVVAYGFNFGSSQGASTVTVNGVPVTPTSWSPSGLSIGFVVPTGAALGSNPVVATVGGHSTSSPFAVVAPSGTPPNITAVAINTVASLAPEIGPSGVVTITGTSFGTNQGTSTATINGIPLYPTTWNATTITAPITLNTTGQLTVVVSGQPSSCNIVGGTCKFTVDGATPAGPPAVTQLININPYVAAVGDTVLISGFNFGAGGSVRFAGGSTASYTIRPSDPSQVVVQVPVGAQSGLLTVTPTHGTTSLGVNFIVTPSASSTPVISSLTPTSGFASESVVIDGSGFGLNTGQVKFNGVVGTILGWSPREIVAQAPSGVTTGSVIVYHGETARAVGGQAATGTTTFVLTQPLPPDVAAGTGCSPATPPCWSVTGSGIPANDTLASISADRMTVVLTSATTTTSAANPLLTLVSLAGSAGSTFTATAAPTPTVTSVSPSSGIGAPVTFLIIKGTNFGLTHSTSTVTVGGVPVANSSNGTPLELLWSATEIVVPLPLTNTSAGIVAGVNLPVVVTVGGASSSGGPTFTTSPLPPNITCITAGGTAQPACTTPITSGAMGDLITINGTNLGTQTTGNVTFFPSRIATHIALASWSSTAISFYVPTGALTDIIGVRVYVDGAGSNALAWTSVPNPSSSVAGATSMCPQAGPVGDTVTITGDLFGASPGTVTFDGTTAPITSWAAGSVVVTVPSGAASGQVTLTTAASLAIPVGRYDVSGSIAAGSPYIYGELTQTPSVGTIVTNTGCNFGASPGTISYNGVDAVTGVGGTVWSATTNSVAIPAGATSGPLVVTNASSLSNGTGTYQAIGAQSPPQILGIRPGSQYIGNAPGAANPFSGNYISLEGINFGSCSNNIIGSCPTGNVTFNGVNAPPLGELATAGAGYTANATGSITWVSGGGGVCPTKPVLDVNVSAVGGLSEAWYVSGSCSIWPNGGTWTPSGIGTPTTAAVPFFEYPLWSPNRIFVAVPAGVSAGLASVQVTTAAGATSNVDSTDFTVLATPLSTAPIITDVSPGSGVVGDTIAIFGTQFPTASGGTAAVHFVGPAGSIAATPTNWGTTNPVTGQQVMTVPVPAGIGTNSGDYQITITGSSSLGTSYTYGPFNVEATPPGTSNCDGWGSGTLADGCSGAPTKAAYNIQHSDLLTGYGQRNGQTYPGATPTGGCIHPNCHPSWAVAGMDYPVGPSTDGCTDPTHCGPGTCVLNPPAGGCNPLSEVGFGNPGTATDPTNNVSPNWGSTAQTVLANSSTSGSSTLNLQSLPSGVAGSWMVYGPGIPLGTEVSSVGGSSVGLSHPLASNVSTGTTIYFAPSIGGCFYETTTNAGYIGVVYNQQLVSCPTVTSVGTTFSAGPFDYSAAGNPTGEAVGFLLGGKLGPCVFHDSVFEFDQGTSTTANSVTGWTFATCTSMTLTNNVFRVRDTAREPIMIGRYTTPFNYDVTVGGNASSDTPQVNGVDLNRPLVVQYNAFINCASRCITVGEVSLNYNYMEGLQQFDRGTFPAHGDGWYSAFYSNNVHQATMASASISGTTFTPGTIVGTLAAGQLLQDATGTIKPNTILAGSTGAWTVTPSQTVAAEAMTASIAAGPTACHCGPTTFAPRAAVTVGPFTEQFDTWLIKGDSYSTSDTNNGAEFGATCIPCGLIITYPQGVSESITAGSLSVNLAAPPGSLEGATFWLSPGTTIIGTGQFTSWNLANAQLPPLNDGYFIQYCPGGSASDPTNVASGAKFTGPSVLGSWDGDAAYGTCAQAGTYTMTAVSTNTSAPFSGGGPYDLPVGTTDIENNVYIGNATDAGGMYGPGYSQLSNLISGGGANAVSQNNYSDLCGVYMPNRQAPPYVCNAAAYSLPGPAGKYNPLIGQVGATGTIGPNIQMNNGTCWTPPYFESSVTCTVP